MTPETIPQTVLFPDLFDKPLFAQFNQEQASSDGGAVLLKAAERAYGLVADPDTLGLDELPSLNGHLEQRVRLAVASCLEVRRDVFQPPEAGTR